MSVTVSFYLEQPVPGNDGWFAWRSPESPFDEKGAGATKEAAIADLLAKATPELPPISVRDHLPQDGQLVLFWVLNPTLPWRPFWRSGSFVDKGPHEQYFVQRATGNNLFTDEVTHWLPAPPAPDAPKDTLNV